jgi:hypothetical protein
MENKNFITSNISGEEPVNFALYKYKYKSDLYEDCAKNTRHIGEISINDIDNICVNKLELLQAYVSIEGKKIDDESKFFQFKIPNNIQFINGGFNIMTLGNPNLPPSVMVYYSNNASLFSECKVRQGFVHLDGICFSNFYLTAYNKGNSIINLTGFDKESNSVKNLEINLEIRTPNPFYGKPKILVNAEFIPEYLYKKYFTENFHIIEDISNSSSLLDLTNDIKNLAIDFGHYSANKITSKVDDKYNINSGTFSLIPSKSEFSYSFYLGEDVFDFIEGFQICGINPDIIAKILVKSKDVQIELLHDKGHVKCLGSQLASKEFEESNLFLLPYYYNNPNTKLNFTILVTDEKQCVNQVLIYGKKINYKYLESIKNTYTYNFLKGDCATNLYFSKSVTLPDNYYYSHCYISFNCDINSFFCNLSQHNIEKELRSAILFVDVIGDRKRLLSHITSNILNITDSFEITWLNSKTANILIKLPFIPDHNFKKLSFPIELNQIKSTGMKFYDFRSLLCYSKHKHQPYSYYQSSISKTNHDVFYGLELENDAKEFYIVMRDNKKAFIKPYDYKVKHGCIEYNKSCSLGEYVKLEGLKDKKIIEIQVPENDNNTKNCHPFLITLH